MPELASGILFWLASITVRVAVVFLVLVLSSAGILATYDLLAGHRLIVGLGYILALEGGFVALVAAIGLQGISHKVVMTHAAGMRGSGLPPAVFYNTIFKPVSAAMRSTPRNYYDNCIILVVSGTLEALLGMALLS